MEIQTVLDTLKEKYIGKEIFIYENININSNYIFYSFLETTHPDVKVINKHKGTVENVEIDYDIEDYNYVLTIKCNNKFVCLKLPQE